MNEVVIVMNDGGVFSVSFVGSPSYRVVDQLITIFDSSNPMRNVVLPVYAINVIAFGGAQVRDDGLFYEQRIN